MFVARRRLAAVAGVAIVCVVIAATARATHLAVWSAALKIDTINGNSAELNTTSLDGCPIQSPDGLSLYIASNRPGGLGGLDIWVANRASTTAPYGAPENLGEPVNSAADDFCPTPVGKKGLFFVSREALPGALRSRRHLLHALERRGSVGRARAPALCSGRPE